MTKLKTLIASILITAPVLALDAAQLPVAHGALPAISEIKPTTNAGCYIWVCWNGIWIYVATC